MHPPADDPSLDPRRRALLRQAAALPLVAAGTRLFAAAPGLPRLLMVFLRGACDMASVLVPTGSDDYLAVRPRIAIARPGSGPEAALALPGLGADWGLAPALADSLAPRIERGELAFVPFAGTHDLSRSHFETQEHIERGQPDDASGAARDFRSGFLNRLAEVIGAGRDDTIALTRELPLILRGRVAVPNLQLAALRPGRDDERRDALLRRLYQGTALAGSVDDGLAARHAAQQTLDAGMEAAGHDAITARGFEGEARRIARLMQARWRLGFIDIGGWDTHVNQGGASGALATRLGELGRGLAAFADELGPATWHDTVVVVLSEFGRTFRENGSRGTDHGHGTTYLVLGGAVRGGRVVGEQVPVSLATLHQGRDWPVLNEYRQVLGGLFRRLYGLDEAQLDRVFAGVRGTDLGLI